MKPSNLIGISHRITKNPLRLLGIFLASLLPCTALSQVSSEPYLLESSPDGILDLGVVHTDTIKDVVHLVNPGSRTIYFRARGSSGGMVAYSLRSSLEPGDTADITILWRVKDQHGKKHRILLVYHTTDSSDWNPADTIITQVFVDVRRGIIANVSMIVFESVPRSETSQGSISLNNVEDSTVTVTMPSPIRDERYSVTFSLPDGNRVEPGKSIRLVAEFKPNYDISSEILQPIRLRTSSLWDPILDIAMYVYPSASREHPGREKR